MNQDAKALISKEVMRMEEDALHSFKGHYNAADGQNRLHLWLGLPAAIIAAIAGGTALGQETVAASVLAFISAILVGAMTFLKPSEKAEQHKASASRYHSLRNNLRRFREIELPTNDEVNVLKEKLTQYADTLNELNEISPQIPRSAYEKAKKDIDTGRAAYHADKEVKR